MSAPSLLHPSFVALRKRESRIEGDMTMNWRRAFSPWTKLLSGNGKTGISLDFPVGHTCVPTPLCSEVCYAKRSGSPVSWDKSLRARLRTMRYIVMTPVEEVVDRLIKEHRLLRRARAHVGRIDFLRVCGTGDLFPAVIPVLNRFAERCPEIPLWVVSRKLNLAAQLARLPNIYLQLSLDSTTPSEQLAAARALVADHPRAYLSYLRVAGEEAVPGDVSIIFNMKKGKGTDHAAIPYEPRSCPGDAGRLDLGNERGLGGSACSLCRKCFSPAVLGRVAA